MKPWDAIEKLLRDGNKLKIWSSGDRVAKVELRHLRKRVGYGQCPSLYEAIRRAVEDYEVSGRNPKDIYGHGKVYQDFDRDSEPKDELERWIIHRDYTLRASWDGRKIVISMDGSLDETPPPFNPEYIHKIGRGDTFAEALLAAWLCIPKPQ